MNNLADNIANYEGMDQEALETHNVMDRQYITWVSRDSGTLGTSIIFSGSEGECLYYMSTLVDPGSVRYYIQPIA